MLVVERNEKCYTYTLGMQIEPLNYSGEIVIVFDPSKTNMAIIIGTPTGECLNNLEFSGNNRRRGPTMDTTLYVQEFRAFLRAYIGHCSIYLAATEATIEKKGTSYYTSNLVLTDIRSGILNFFAEQFSVKCIEINNWSWKHAILPDGYRSQSEKGSKRYLQTYFPELGIHDYFEADMSDVTCIYWYCLMKLCKNYSLLCKRIEQPVVDYKYTIVPVINTSYTQQITQVVYNDKFSVEDNVVFYVNRIMSMFTMDVPVNKLPIESIYSHAVTSFKISNMNDSIVRLVISRC